MKKFILLVALSVLFYSAPGYAGKRKKHFTSASSKANTRSQKERNKGARQAAALAEAEERAEQAQKEYEQLGAQLQNTHEKVKEAYNQYGTVSEKLRDGKKNESLDIELKDARERWNDAIKERHTLFIQREKAREAAQYAADVAARVRGTQTESPAEEAPTPRAAPLAADEQ